MESRLVHDLLSIGASGIYSLVVARLELVESLPVRLELCRLALWELAAAAFKDALNR